MERRTGQEREGLRGSEGGMEGGWIVIERGKVGWIVIEREGMREGGRDG